MIWEEWKDILRMPMLIGSVISLFFILTAVYRSRKAAVPALPPQVCPPEPEPAPTETPARADRLAPTVETASVELSSDEEESMQVLSRYVETSIAPEEPSPPVRTKINGNYFLQLSPGGDVQPFQTEVEACYLWR